MLILSLRVDGEYASDTIVISIPRQVGKTYLIGCIIFALCLMKPGLRVIWTAQVKDTALETFEQFYDMSQRPQVKPHIAKTPQGKGDEAIVFTNGSKIEFGARDSGFGRGRTDVDVLVFDEGQHLSLQALENMGAAQNVADNPLCFVMGTPPRPQDKGEYFQVTRQEALDGESDGTLYIEMSADRDGDPMDREQWRKANPSFPRRTSERAMLRLRKKLKNDDSWRREALGIWDEILKHQPAVRMSTWNDLVDIGPADGTRPNALGIDMSPAGEISVNACWVDGDAAHCEEVWAGWDLDAAATWVISRSLRRTPITVGSESPAVALVPLLRSRKLNVKQASMLDAAKAYGLLIPKVRPGLFTHGGQGSVTDALKVAPRRPIGKSGGLGWDTTDEALNIAPIVAMTWGLYGAETTKHAHRGGAAFL
ncbi:terminase [Nocardia rhizosphaerae]|uniref:Terminase n=1 Tax=Nocardia rhizosphaerae TaxID=1691571 RepID=A0ABV8L277_9NOCA